MRVQCKCGIMIEISDAEVRQYMNMLAGQVKSEAKAESSRENARKPRPGSIGNQRAKKGNP